MVNSDDIQERSDLWFGWAAVDLSMDQGSNESRLRSVAQNLRVVRSLDAAAPITVRDEELSVLGRILDLNDPMVVPQVMRAFTLDKKAANDLVGRIQAAVDEATSQPQTQPFDPFPSADPFPPANPHPPEFRADGT